MSSIEKWWKGVWGWIKCKIFGKDCDEPSSNRVIIKGTNFELNGKRFYPIADTAWQLLKVSDPDIIHYLDTRKAQGFNVIKFGIECDTFGNSVNKPNEMRLLKIERILRWLKERNMFAELGLGPIMNYDKNIRIPLGEREKLGEVVGERFNKYDNIWAWIVGGLDDKFNVSQIKGIEKGLRKKDPIRIVGYHPAHNQQYECDFTYAQSGHKNLTENNVINLQNKASKTKPWYDGEPCYEHLAQYGNESHIIDHNDIIKITKAGLNRKAGLTYGSIKVALFENGWKNKLNSKGVQEFLKIANNI